MRAPTVAGQFYEADKEKLLEQIEGCFTSKLGPGKINAAKNSKRGTSPEKFIRAAIMPHAGYFFSGSCAAHGYKKIAESASSESNWPDVFLILGLSHSGSRSAASLDDWKTPFGIMETDKKFTKLVMEKTGISANESAHRQEHSIEVQVPFMQYICESTGQNTKITPLIISHDADVHEIGKGIAAAIKEYEQKGKKVCIIASSDFTHYGYNYGYAPFTANIKENIRKLDMAAIKQIEALNSDKFLEYIESTGATICGYMPIAALLAALQEISSASGQEAKAKVLSHYQSSDVLGEYPSNSVSYACIVFE